MAKIRKIPTVFKGMGLSDALDAESAFSGAMSILQNLIPHPGDDGVFVPRPASTSLLGSQATATVWGSFNWGAANWGGGWGGIKGAQQVNGLIIVGNTAYGMIASNASPYAGTDVPFSFNILTQTFNDFVIPGGISALPTTPAVSGDWTPPRFAAFPGKIMVTHPGFPGGAPGPYIGWMDFSGFSDATRTGNTHSNKTIDNLSTNVLLAGWTVGMTIAGAGIPLNTTITAIAVGGTSITLSNNATATAVGVALTVAGGTASAPLWCSGNTNGQALTAVPTDVFNFNGRAYYAVPGGGTQFSDSAVPTQITNATQVLKPNNALDITSFGGLPYWQSQGGILQALIAFQGDSQAQQITGDAATNNLAMNSIGKGVGCLAPNSIAQTPIGMMFIASDGLRYIDFQGNIKGPLGAYGKGVNLPIVNAVSPSRIAADYNQDVYRFSVQDGSKTGQPTVEYWFHLSKGVFSGPHTFPASVIAAYQAPTGSSLGRGFVMAASGVNANLWSSPVIPSLNSTYVENGTTLTCIWQSLLSKDNDQMTENSIVDGTLALIMPAAQALSVVVTNELNSELGRININGPVGVSKWGTLVWGQGVWGSTPSAFYQRDLAWAQPLVYKQMQCTITTQAALGLAIGALRYTQQVLGYRLETAGQYV